jgi:serine/threonine protein kinase
MNQSDSNVENNTIEDKKETQKNAGSTSIIGGLKQTTTPQTPNLIGSGTYGCVFHPGVHCNKKNTIPNAQIVTKIQEREKELLREVNVGNLIKQIPNYKNRFAPIIESCAVNLSTIGDNVLEKCELGVNKQNSSNFISSTIPYVSKYTLLSYLEKLLVKTMEKTPIIKSGQTQKKIMLHAINSFLKKMIEIHIYLIESLQVLQKNNILHLDLRYNNILYDDRNNVPIIIDYGLSVLWPNLKTPLDYMESFSYNRHETCTYWSIDCVLFMYVCKYILQKDSTRFQELEVKIGYQDVANMKKTLKIYILGDGDRKNRHVGMSLDEIKRFETKATHFINSFLGKPWKELWATTKNMQNTWDNYSLAQVFYKIIYNFGLMDPDVNINFMHKYIDILKKIITSEPGKRMNFADTITSMKNLTKHIKKIDISELANKIKKKVSQPNYAEQTRKRVAEFKLNDLRNEQFQRIIPEKK